MRTGPLLEPFRPTVSVTMKLMVPGKAKAAPVDKSLPEADQVPSSSPVTSKPVEEEVKLSPKDGAVKKRLKARA